MQKFVKIDMFFRSDGDTAIRKDERGEIEVNLLS